MGKTQALKLTEEDRAALEKIMRTRTVQAQIMTRARILLLKANGETVDAIADKVGLCRNSVKLCLKKYKDGGIERALHDDQRSGRPPVYTDEERTWIVNVACKKPKDFGYAAELWSNPLLARHIKQNAERARLSPAREGVKDHHFQNLGRFGHKAAQDRVLLREARSRI